MVSVTQRVAQVKQPRGGYLHPRLPRTEYVGSDRVKLIDHQGENVHSSLAGLAVDYLTPVATGAHPRDAFGVSLCGARRISAGAAEQAEIAMAGLTTGQVDAAAIAAACRLASFDVGARNNPELYRPDAQTAPDSTTTAQVGAMVGRTGTFLESQGGIMLDGFNLLCGYTDVIDRGDGDYVTPGVVWDLKVSTAPPTNTHTLQLLLYLVPALLVLEPVATTAAAGLGIGAGAPQDAVLIAGLLEAGTGILALILVTQPAQNPVTDPSQSTRVSCLDSDSDA